ncbi:hypothetical protein RHGRI_020638 [Rhododendron griersonianum]|uniref:Uncharacterized protein n=1 Tax=Rhododendron griersonianum TaxID=479676 RepID=A0AAV6JID8_9ERIC|nr:hypothetical protein RHGRI_020638 [Rhododendron griersonianum]
MGDCSIDTSEKNGVVILILLHIAIASAAAVPSSSKEAFDMGRPVRSVITV